ncbi:Capsular polysaccharide synthesis protein [Lachnospiraceae bacterium XBB2008]|nr:Capsular polysaccharide synthesis protein [Lachnospiraceae bacterium XBB2008]
MVKLCSYDDYRSVIRNNPVILFGAGKSARRIIETEKVNCRFLIDNNPALIGTSIVVGTQELVIYSWEYYKKIAHDRDILLITPIEGYTEILNLIENDGYMDSCDIYVPAYIDAFQWDKDRITVSKEPYSITKKAHSVIPKRINYIWFSGDPFPDKVKKCMDSWHKYCPDYDFVEWNLDNYFTDSDFFNEAISVRQWAFASDYTRCDVLCREGGIYLDTDVELVKPLDDLLYDDGFLCFESSSGVDPGSGMASVPNNPIFKEIRDQYESEHFIKDDGSYNKKNIVYTYTAVLERHGLISDGRYQIVDGIAVYPPLVFSPYSYMTGLTNCYEKTYAIHHWISAWISDELRKELEMKKRIFSRYYNEYNQRQS